MNKLIFSWAIILALPAAGKWSGSFGMAQFISTIAGTGVLGYNGDGIPATTATFNYPAGVAIDGSGNLYITDMNNCRVRKISKSTGLISTIAGTGVTGFSGDGGPATAAQVSNYVIGVTLDPAGNIYIADGSDNCLRKITVSTGIITTLAGTGSYSGGYSGDGGPATASQLNYPVAVAVSTTGFIYLADCYNHRIRKINVSTGIITTAAGTGVIGSSGDGGPATSAKLNYPAGVACDAAGNVYIGDNGNNKIRKINAATGIITTIAGTGATGSSGDGGPATSAKLNCPQGVVLGASGNIYFADGLNYRIRKITVSTGIISKVAGTSMGFSGDGGPAVSAQLNNANGIAVDAAGNSYMADAANQRIRKVSAEPLPVEWLSFSGKNAGTVNHLFWTTASETNNDHFEIERSTDGSGFRQIGVIAGKGNSSSPLDYFYDDASFPGAIHYYRIKQVDINGVSAFSATIAIESEINQLHFWYHQNVIRIINRTNLPVTLMMWDMTGKLTKQIEMTEPEFSMETVDLPKGIYYIRLLAGRESMGRRIVIN